MASTVYKRLAGKISIISAFAIFILLAISLFIATFLEYTWRLYRIYKEEYIVTFGKVLKEAPQIILETPEIKSVFTKDLLINGGILIIGFIITFIWPPRRPSHRSHRRPRPPPGDPTRRRTSRRARRPPR